MDNNENDLNQSEKINISRLRSPILVCALGLILCIACSRLSTSVNVGVLLGLMVLIIGTILFLSTLYQEIHRIGIETPFPLDVIFPSYPIVKDKDEIDKHISGFRRAYGEFVDKRTISENSSIQSYAAQLLWHCLVLQKKRMEKFGLTLQFQSSRRAYISKKESVRSETYFDGRYDAKDVSEEIDALRSYYYKGRVIKRLYDKEVAHYTLLSAKETVDHKVVCPNCGSISTKENLIDGCDYCRTKFTVEDIENSVASFGFRRDFKVSESKKDVITELIYPWVFMITEIPLIYFGLFGAFLYMDESIIARLVTGVVAGGLLGLLGWCIAKLNMIIVVPIVNGLSSSWEKKNRNLIYREMEEQDQERNIAEYVRKFDSKFSIQSFFGGVQNKLMAIHYADRKEQINAFSDIDISNYLDNYSDIIDVDIMKMTLCFYDVKEGMQNAIVKSEMILRGFQDGKIIERKENVKMRLSKSESCKTQAVCGPSIMKCSSCGSSLSLMEGKKCAYCGRELDLKKFDWVIMEYDEEE